MRPAVVIALCGFALARLALGLAPAAAQEIDRRWGPTVESAPSPTAVGGYCVVTLHDRREWVPGDERNALVFDGQQYFFSGPRQRDIFAAAPATYAPMLAGDCPVTLSETNERVRGQLDCGMLHSGRLVFFASPGRLQQFRGDPARFENVDLALGGLCSVTRRATGRDVPGIPETVALRDGLRYWFASANDRSTFLGEPAAPLGDAAPVGAAEAAEVAVASSTPTPSPWNPWAAGPPKSRSRRPRPGAGEDELLGALPSLAGYCPVTLRKSGAWVRGRYEHRVKLDELVFLTAGPLEREAFEKDPARYVPALGGDCPVSLVARDERIRGSVYHAYEYEGRLFLFADADRKAAFKANPVDYAAVDLAAEGRCVVTQVDQQREVPGVAEHAAWRHGKLYRFAGPDERRAFLADPEKYAPALKP